jgi:basic amino acid/polyamine antiporter, APA family
VAGSGDFSFEVGGAQLTACSLIAAFTLLNCLRVDLVARVQNALTSVKVLAILGFILIGLLVGSGSWAHFSEPAVPTSTTPIAAQFLVSLLWVMVGYSGWNAATYVAGEIREPSRTLHMALAIGTAVVAVLYLGLNRHVHLLHSAREDERCRGGRVAGSFESFRTWFSRGLQCPDGGGYHVYG